VASFLELPFVEGLVITDVAPGSPAERSGLQKYDVILKMDGKKAEKSADLPAKVRSLKPGSVISLEVYRNGKRVQVNAKLGEAP
jgi:serine protease Do